MLQDWERKTDMMETSFRKMPIAVTAWPRVVLRPRARITSGA